jgi:hypothetical protein
MRLSLGCHVAYHVNTFTFKLFRCRLSSEVFGRSRLFKRLNFDTLLLSVSVIFRPLAVVSHRNIISES